MINQIRKFTTFIVVFSLVLVTSCGSDDDGGPITPTTNDTLVGNLEEDLTLDATVGYKLTGTYTVKSGNKLTIPAGTVITATPGTSTYIAVEQGAQIEINGTASLPVIMTSSATTSGDWGGLVIAGEATTTEGIDAIAEVGGIVYGGTNDTDNSGSINYLIINYAGAQINSESQFNGLTLYAVGSATSISNVAMLNGTDDGVEFFGGTVSASNFYFENNEDDSVDWTEGWNGTLTNAYVLHTISGFSTAVEADGVNGNPKLVNFTAVSNTGGTALQFKKESGATITGLSLTGYDTSLDFKDDGALSNVQIEGADSDPLLNYTVPATVDVTMFDWVNSNQTGNATLLQGTISGTVTLDASVSYTLNSSYIVQDGGKLVIPAGTKITARAGGTGVYIAVLKGGEIEVNGTAAEPVVIASADGNPSDWGGLVICGNATTTEGIDAVAEIGGFIYGGNTDNDNSGSVTYLVLRGTGAQINSESQYNGLSLYAVGSGTTIENIAVYDGADDGVEFFGGTVNATNVYVENTQDDAIDWTEGWNGTLTNTYVSHTAAGFSTAVEADGINGNPTIVNFTAISTQGGTALQFKKESGATMTNVLLTDYTTNVDMKDDGSVANVIVDSTPLTAVTDDVFNATALDISGWSWRNAGL
ncbi:hypothetical protein [Aquimarina sp. 2201CG14-23]|uniref:hypothetical protein n=1 Tax=Aquimarina mycalae TaxID=3040073 RepID=UPI0024782C65|nr:hypothetical protein [Aquimarina sp. 2201CG14-23]MDH7446007.1 hypothetical protein [Aquimarina sp. 2201CG14-23]